MTHSDSAKGPPSAPGQIACLESRFKSLIMMNHTDLAHLCAAALNLYRGASPTAVHGQDQRSSYRHTAMQTLSDFWWGKSLRCGRMFGSLWKPVSHGFDCSAVKIYSCLQAAPEHTAQMLNTTLFKPSTMAALRYVAVLLLSVVLCQQAAAAGVNTDTWRSQVVRISLQASFCFLHSPTAAH